MNRMRPDDLKAHVAATILGEIWALPMSSLHRDSWNRRHEIAASETTALLDAMGYAPPASTPHVDLFARKDWRCEYCGLIVPGLAYHDCKEGTLKAENAKLREALEKAAETERERIIAILTGPGSLSACLCESVMHTPLTPDQLRRAITGIGASEVQP